jgi:hypothetical protein
MNNREPHGRNIAGPRKMLLGLTLAIAGILLSALQIDGGQGKVTVARYKVLAPTTHDNLTIFPIVTDFNRDTHSFLTLDEGLRSGQVVITEEGGSTGLVRPRPGVRPWPERPIPERRGYGGAQVNRLVLFNNSDRPLILLAGEIVTGGKQDRVVGKDRIIPAKADPVDLSVFCVEPHRWVEMSAHFGGFNFAMAQPSVRLQAMATKDQGAVWDQVAKSRESVAAAVAPSAARALAETSSYARSFGNSVVQQQVDGIAGPIERSYDKLMSELRAQHAVGAIVAINGEIVWADAFASTSLFDKYWPKLIRSYAAEAVSARLHTLKMNPTPSTKEAQMFFDDLNARSENVESEPGVYRNTEMKGQDFDAFILASLLPGSNFDVHVAKMRD